jgi:hypothetical protein
MMGMTETEYLSSTVRYNVVNDGDTSTTSKVVRKRIKDLIVYHRLRGKPKFLVLGRSAAAALPPSYRYQPFGYPLRDVLIIPHTSGRNRLYNSQDYKLFIEQSLRGFLGRSSR